MVRFFLTLFFLTVASLHAEQLPTIFSQTDIKEKIAHLQNQIAHCEHSQKENLLLELAILYTQDQQHERAFSTFLLALETPSSSPLTLMSKDEEKLYQQALQLYLDRHATSPQEMAKQLIEQYQDIVKANPQYVRLGYLLAAAYANSGQFEIFFRCFFNSYCKDPDHFIAYKTKAILHAKLFHLAKTAEERELQRKATLTHLAAAIARYPQDTSLYKMAILSAAETDRPTVLETYLSKIVNENIILPRSDLSFYVQHCIHTNQIALAQRFVDKAREWYQYSQAIEMAQAQIDQKKKTP